LLQSLRQGLVELLDLVLGFLEADVQLAAVGGEENSQIADARHQLTPFALQIADCRFEISEICNLQSAICNPYLISPPSATHRSLPRRTCSSGDRRFTGRGARSQGRMKSSNLAGQRRPGTLLATVQATRAKS